MPLSGHGVLKETILRDLSCQDPLNPLHASTRSVEVNPPVVSVQGRLKQHENFWLNELEPPSFVAGIITGVSLAIFEAARSPVSAES